MTKKRKIKILKMTKDNIKSSNHSGICFALLVCYNVDIITFKEYRIMENLIYQYKPKKMFSKRYFYKRYLKSPRIRLLNKIIEDLQK